MPEQIDGIQQGFDLKGKIRLTVRFAYDLKALISKRSSQPTIRLANYVGSTTTTQNLGGILVKATHFSKTT